MFVSLVIVLREVLIVIGHDASWLVKLLEFD